MCIWSTVRLRVGRVRTAGANASCTIINRSGNGGILKPVSTRRFSTQNRPGASAASKKAVGEHLGLSWDEIEGIMGRAVEGGLNRREAEPIRRLGVDEKAFQKGHKYFTLVNDLDRPRVLYVAEDRKKSSLDGFWETLTEAQKEGIEAVAMDMWDPYIASVREHLVDGETKIVFDKFHVAKHLGGQSAAQGTPHFESCG